jgi:hypothetical protein
VPRMTRIADLFRIPWTLTKKVLISSGRTTLLPITSARNDWMRQRRIPCKRLRIHAEVKS